MAKPERPSSLGGGSPGDASRPNSGWWNPSGPVLPVGARPAIHPGQTASLRAAHRCVSVEIHSRNTLGIPPSRALSAGRLAGQFSRWGPRRSRGFHHRLFTAPLRVVHRCASVEIRSGQLSRGGSSLARLVSQAPRRYRRLRHLIHRLPTQKNRRHGSGSGTIGQPPEAAGLQLRRRRFRILNPARNPARGYST